MTTRQPTQEEIQHAEEMQRLGICQRSMHWLWYIEEKGYEIDSSDGFFLEIEQAKRNCKRIGPLSTATECLEDFWSSMPEWARADVATQKFLDKVQEYLLRNGYTGKADEAFRQALIELAKEG